MKQLCDIIDFAKEKRLRLVFGSFVLDCTGDIDSMTEGMLKMMGVFSEIERNMTSFRVKSGMRNARSKGRLIGRPKLKKDDMPQKVLDMFNIYDNGLITNVTSIIHEAV